METIPPYKRENVILNLAFDFALAIIGYTEVLEEKMNGLPWLYFYNK